MSMAVVALGAAPCAWVTLSQARLGAQLDVIREESRGNYSRSVAPLQRLGYLWQTPADPTSSVGLGGGIGWAWDPTLCAALLPPSHAGRTLTENKDLAQHVRQHGAPCRVCRAGRPAPCRGAWT